VKDKARTVGADSAESIDKSVVFSALLEAQQAIASVVKDARANYGERARYSYVSADQMVTECRKALHHAGLVVLRDSYTVDLSPSHGALLLSNYLIVHAASGASITSTQSPWFIIETQGRPFDKALAGALTTALSYFLRDLLLVPRDDEEEMDRRNDTAHQPNTIGIKGAMALRASLVTAGCKEAGLRAAMQQSGVSVPDDMAQWDRSWMDRIHGWIERNTVHSDISHEDASLVPPSLR